MMLLDLIAEGRIQDFFITSVPSGNMQHTFVQPPGYNILVYIVFAIWDLPIWLLQRYAAVDVMNNFAGLMWIRMMPVLALGYSAYLLHSILTIMTEDRRKADFGCFLYLTSLIVFSSVILIVQYDILLIVWMLLALRAYLKEDLKGFILFAGISLCFKYFSLLFILPLLLLKQKNVWKLIRDVVLLAIPLLLTTLPFRSTMQDASNFTIGLLVRYIRSEEHGFNIRVLTLLLINIYCFVRPWTGSKRDGETAVWAVFLSMAVMFAMGLSHPYWLVMVAPFLYIILIVRPQHQRSGLILEIVGWAAMVVAQMPVFHYCFFGDTMYQMGLKYIFPKDMLMPEPYKTWDLIMSFKETDYPGVLACVCLACMLGVACCTCPDWQHRRSLMPEPPQREAPITRDLLWLRFAVCAFLILLPTICIFI